MSKTDTDFYSPDLCITTSPKPSPAKRPTTQRRESSLIWQDISETNQISVPPILKKEVAASKARQPKPSSQKFASWFKGSPQDLEEIEDAREDDKRWRKLVRQWKEERHQQLDGEEKRANAQTSTGFMMRLKQALLCG